MSLVNHRNGGNDSSGGSGGGSRLRWPALAGVLLSVTVAVFFAVHDSGFFELGDGTGAPGTGDILGSAAQAGADWADLFNADGSLKDADDDGVPDAREVFGGITALFLADQLSQSGLVDDTIFSQSNKNNDPTSTWNWDTGNNPPKDDLANVYAFAAENAAGQLIIYAGLERLAPEGDSHIDFEFNQTAIGLDKSPSCGGDGSGGAADGAPCEFTGEKTVNDILVVMDFENGGNLGFVEVRRWNGAQYVLIEALGGEGCTGDNAICAFNNGATIPAGPWPTYERHGTTVATLERNQFTEIGINVSVLLDNFIPCISTMQAKTRSSQSFNSELKDFAFGSFGVCSIEVVKTGPDLSKIGDEVTYHYEITNTGAATLYVHSIVDDKIGDLTATAPAACSPLAVGATCAFDSAPFTIPEGAEDPFVNVVSVDYDPVAALSGPHITGEDDHSISLFQPCVRVDKTGDILSKAGDPVSYVVTVTNCSSSDSPDLVNGTIVDSLLGDLLDPANPYVTGSTCSATLATGASCAVGAVRIVQADDPNPLGNTVTVHYNPSGFPNDITDHDSHSVELFQPGVRVEKTGDALSKVGDAVGYTITITNTSSANSPDLINGTVVDSLLGDLLDPANPFVTGSTCAGTLAPGASCAINATRTVQAGDPDPLPNTVTVHYNPAGFPNDITSQASHSVNLFQPGVRVEKTGDALAKIGDPVDYTITVTNTSSADSPGLVNGTIVDTLLGDLLDAANPYVTGGTCGTTLATGESCVIQAARTVEATDPDPLPNTVTVHYNPDGFPNDITAQAGHSVELFQPCVRVEKSGDTLSKVGDAVDYTITVTNCGSADSPDLVNGTIVDSLAGILVAPAPGGECEPGQDCGTDPGPGPTPTPTPSPGPGNLSAPLTHQITGNSCTSRLPAGATCEIRYSRIVLASDTDPLPNTVTVHYHPDGFPNDITASASHTVELFQPGVRVEKTGTPLSKAGDVAAYSITVTNTSSADSPALVNGSIVDSLLGNLLDPANPYATGSNCAATLPTGGSCSISAARAVLASDPDPLPNTVTVHYNPDGFPNDITASASHSVELFQPGVRVDKSCGPKTVSPGQSVNYTITVTNISSADSPNLVNGSIVDSLLGNLLDPANPYVTGSTCSSTLATGGVCTITASRTAQTSDPDPLPNTVTVHYNPQGFPNDITAEARCSVRVQAGCAHSPGFWKGGSGVPHWDQATDLLNGNPVPFTTNTCFPYLAPRLDPPPAGGADCTTYLGVLNLPTRGDITIQLAFKYIAARLDEAAFGVPPDIASLLDAIEVYFGSYPVGSNPTDSAKTQGQALLAPLNNWFTTVGDTNCPTTF